MGKTAKIWMKDCPEGSAPTPCHGLGVQEDDMDTTLGTAERRGEGGMSSGAGNTWPQIIPHLPHSAGLWLQSASITSTIREGDLSVSKLKAGRLRVHFFNE